MMETEKVSETLDLGSELRIFSVSNGRMIVNDEMENNVEGRHSGIC
jgi:hypothetical protein